MAQDAVALSPLMRKMLAALRQMPKPTHWPARADHPEIRDLLVNGMLPDGKPFPFANQTREVYGTDLDPPASAMGAP